MITLILRDEDVEDFAHIIELVSTAAHVAADEGFYTDAEYGEGAGEHINDHAETLLAMSQAILSVGAFGGTIEIGRPGSARSDSAFLN